MKNLVLTTIGDMKHAELASMFQSQGVTLVEREAHESEIKELMFYCSPESYLAYFNVPESDVANKLAVWEKETLAQLDYVISNPERCLLIELEFALQNLCEFGHYIKDNLNITLAENMLGCFDATKQIQSCILLIDDDVQDTYEEIAAAADLYNKEGNQTVIERLFLYSSAQQNQIDDIALLQIKNSEESEKANAKCAELEVALVNLNNEQEQLQANQISAIERAETKVDGLGTKLETAYADNNSIKEEINQLNVERAELKSESEMALLQINQLQEELESLFVEREQSQSRIEEESKTKVNGLNTKLESAYTENKTYSLEKKQFNKHVGKLETELETSLLQINQLQAELESIFVEKEQLNTEVVKLNSKSELSVLKIKHLQEELEVNLASTENIQTEQTKFIETAQIKANNLIVKLENCKGENKHLCLEKEQLNTYISGLNSEFKQLQMQHTKATQETETKVNGLTAKLERSRAENTNISQEKDHLNTKKTELNSENELALLQINQLQEELEYYFMKLQSNKGQELALKTPVVNIVQMKASLQLAKILK
ncbi:MAG: hypothetical protein HRT54_06745 [Colwellia sp.]|nr:hypothetical protein [Colwellia sp.]